MNETSATVAMATANASSQAISKLVLSVANVGVVSSGQSNVGRYRNNHTSTSTCPLILPLIDINY